jgi:hypothetical protein
MADIVITAANVLPSTGARFSQQKAGVAITAGQTVYFDTASGTVKLAKANGAAPANTLFGIAAETAAANQQILIIQSDPALAIGGTIASGTTCWLSVVNAGGISSTGADDVAGGTMTRINLGIGTGSNVINFSPIVGGVLP